MSYFIFNDITSEDLGLIVTQPVIRPSWSETVSEIVIPGNPRTHKRFTGNYEDINFTIHTAMMDATPEKMHLIYQKLQGEGDLIISTAPAEYLRCRIAPLVPEPIALFTAEIPIGVTAYPFANALNQSIIDITDTTYPIRVENNGTIFSEPTIEFLPVIVSGEENTSVFSVNGKLFEVKTPPDALTEDAEKIVINCENQICYYVHTNGNEINCTQYTYHDFPKLHIGDNYIQHTNEMQFCRIYVRERFL